MPGLADPAVRELDLGGHEQLVEPDERRLGIALGGGLGHFEQV